MVGNTASVETIRNNALKILVRKKDETRLKDLSVNRRKILKNQDRNVWAEFRWIGRGLVWMW